MKDFLSLIINTITGMEIEIEEKEDIQYPEAKIFVAYIPQEKMGQLIGKEGKTIKAIRTLMMVKTNSQTKNQQNFLRLEEIVN
jgi:predicted RNA-binding protein YlqC (UPF0109 family)